MSKVKEDTKGILLAACLQANRYQHDNKVISSEQMLDRYNLIIGIKDKIMENSISDSELIAAYEVLIEQLLSI